MEKFLWNSHLKIWLRDPFGRTFLFSALPSDASNVLQVLLYVGYRRCRTFCGAVSLGSVGSTAILVTMFTGFSLVWRVVSMYLPPSILAPGKSRLFPIRSTLLLSSVSAAVWPCYYSVSALQDLSLRSYIQRKNWSTALCCIFAFTSLECLPWLFITAVMLFSAQTVIQQGRYAICSLQAF